MGDRGVGQDPVTEVEDVAGACGVRVGMGWAKAVEYTAHLGGDLRQAAGVGVAHDRREVEYRDHKLVPGQAQKTDHRSAVVMAIEPLETLRFEIMAVQRRALPVKAVEVAHQALHPLLKAAGTHDRPAKVINIGSIDGIRLNPWETYSYHASKAAILYLTKRMAARLIQDQINVTAIAPGAFASDMNRAARDHADAVAQKDWDDSVQQLAAGFPTVITRMAEHIDWTEQVGDAVLVQTDDVLDSVQRLRALAITSSQRLTAYPDLPTIAEAAIPGFESVNWVALFSPRGTAVDVINRINSEVNRVVQLPSIREHFVNLGAEPLTGTPLQWSKYVRDEVSKWAKVIKESDVRIE